MSFSIGMHLNPSLTSVLGISFWYVRRLMILMLFSTSWHWVIFRILSLISGNKICVLFILIYGVRTTQTLLRLSLKHHPVFAGVKLLLSNNFQYPRVEHLRYIEMLCHHQDPVSNLNRLINRSYLGSLSKVIQTVSIKHSNDYVFLIMYRSLINAGNMGRTNQFHWDAPEWIKLIIVLEDLDSWPILSCYHPDTVALDLHLIHFGSGLMNLFPVER